MVNKKYVLITPAHNEEEYIQLPIKSVISQTVLPVCWVIVSDRSTDGTDEIIKEYAKKHNFIKYVRKTDDNGRNTAAKVNAIKLGLTHLQNIEYNFIGNLDADISFQPDYFEYLLNKFNENSKLGIIGGRIHLIENNKIVEYKSSMESIAGAVQFFRRECFEQIGGYQPLKGGFEDGLAEISARYHGWETQSYREQAVIHPREIGTVGRSIWRTKFNSGLNEYCVGFGYFYHLIKAIIHFKDKPYIIGSIIIMAGYLWGFITNREKIIPGIFVAHLRKEQKNRIINSLKKI